MRRYRQGVRRSRAGLGVVALLLALAAPAQAAHGPWATVNVCDSAAYPDSIGIRGSMPGTGDRKVDMFMRFRVQFFNSRSGRWRNLVPGGDSGWVRVGNAKHRTRQSGHTFTIAPPAPGQDPFLLRGVVTFEWRRGTTVIHHARRLTTAGHPNTVGSDPPGFTAAICSIT
jgi:hypothetical protein